MTMRYKRVVISIFAISLMLLGMTLLPVSAAFVPTQLEISEQALTADENGHTYLYGPVVEDYTQVSSVHLIHEEDVGVMEYDYQATSWADASYGFNGPATRTVEIPGTISSGFGWLDNYLRLYPSFYETQ